MKKLPYNKKKFYIMEFVPKSHLDSKYKSYYKVGYTQYVDTVNRFKGSVLEEDFTIIPKFSCIVSKDRAEELERNVLTEQFPNPGPTKVWLERACNVSNQKYDNTGVTEIRALNKSQYINLIQWAYKLPEYISQKEYKEKAKRAS